MGSTNSVKLVAETVVEPVVAPVVEPVVAPVVEPVVETVVAPVVDPVVAPVVDPVVAPVVAPVVETVVAPVVETVAEAVVGPKFDTVALEGAIGSSRLVIRMERPRLSLWRDVIATRECRELMAAATPRLVHSAVQNRVALGGVVNETALNSESITFARDSTPLVASLLTRAAALAGRRRETAESLLVMRYKPGHRFLPHCDFFNLGMPSAALYLAQGGQRVATMIIYLTTPESGGDTILPAAGIRIPASAGDAVYFEYPDGDTLTQHGGEEVSAGEKWIATFFFRERDFMPSRSQPAPIG